jgi:hypothetical protein
MKTSPGVLILAGVAGFFIHNSITSPRLQSTETPVAQEQVDIAKAELDMQLLLIEPTSEPTTMPTAEATNHLIALTDLTRIREITEHECRHEIANSIALMESYNPVFDTAQKLSDDGYVVEGSEMFHAALKDFRIMNTQVQAELFACNERAVNKKGFTLKLY